VIINTRDHIMLPHGYLLHRNDSDLEEKIRSEMTRFEGQCPSGPTWSWQRFGRWLDTIGLCVGPKSCIGRIRARGLASHSREAFEAAVESGRI
jgi:hypothetical protein